MSSLPCQTCGSTDYTCHSGFYVCNICDTLSQDIRDERFEFVDFGRVVEDDQDKEEVKSEKSFAERKLTSWECYNIVLKGLAEELIELGASKKIKTLAFQLWTSYLRRSNVAFLSKNEEKFPALSLGFRNKDVNALYGIPNLRAKLIKRPSRRKTPESSGKSSGCESDSASCSSFRSVKSKRRKLASSQLSEASDSQSEYNLSDAETLASLDEERRRRSDVKKSVVFRSSARKILKELSDSAIESRPTSSDRETVRKTRSKFSRLTFDRRFKASKRRSPNAPVTMVTLITILRLAMQVAGDKIFLGDILRWICEGRLSVNQPEKFVPSFYTLVKKNDLMSVRRKGFQLDIRNFTCNLDLCQLPTPDLFELAKRYCEEFRLPNEFAQIVLKIMADSKIEMNYANFEFKIFPDYECRVMALILFVFKMLFSLDDFTEYRQSAFANEANEKLQKGDSPTKDVPKMFSWSAWVRFVECRKAVLSEFSALISRLACKEDVCDENAFFNNWEKVKPTYEAAARTINPALRTALSHEVRSMCDGGAKKEGTESPPEFPVSFTPSSSYADYLTTNCPERLSLDSRHLLSEDFRSYSVKHVISPEWCSNVAKQLEMNVRFGEPSEVYSFESYERPAYSILASCSATLPRCDVSVPVLVEGGVSLVTKKRETKASPFRPAISKCEFKHDRACQDGGLTIIRPSHYWCFHECRKNLSVEEFDDLALANFPKSFLWLIRECASFLQTDVKELYLELIFVEIFLHRLYCKSTKGKLFMKINIKEW